MSANSVSESESMAVRRRRRPPGEGAKVGAPRFARAGWPRSFCCRRWTAICLFIVYPALYSVALSLTNASLIRLEWGLVGLRNYLLFFQDPGRAQGSPQDLHLCFRRHYVSVSEWAGPRRCC